MESFWYNYTIINCLLTIFVHNYYAQPIYYTDVSKCCESLTDWSIPLIQRYLLYSEIDVQSYTVGRMTVDRQGHLTYSHTRDPDWDINDFLLELKSQLHTWRDVYWRVWGIINYLQCTRCGSHFPCTNFGHCLFHPISASFDSTASTPGGDGSNGMVLKILFHLVDIYSAIFTGLSYL